MKWAFLIVAFTSVLPLTGWLRRKPNIAPKIWLAVGFLILQHGPLHLYMAAISWAGQWRGYTYGFEISLLDIVLLALYVTLPKRHFVVPFKFSMGLYFVAVLISAIQALAPEATLFYAWQLLRVFFAYVVIAKASSDHQVTSALLKGMAVGLLFAFAEAIWERFGLGVMRTYGGYSQENFFGVVSHFVVLPFFALLLGGEVGWLPPLVSFSGILISALTVSRATVAVTGFGYVLMFGLSAIAKKWTSRKTTIAGLGFLAVIFTIPFFVASFEARFGNNAESSFFTTDEERIALARAASMMLSDHPLGVGANHFTVIANMDGYYSRNDITWQSLDAVVHNVYWLVAAETGYFGLISFVLMLLGPVVVALRCGWRHRRLLQGELLLGLGIALLTVYLHSLYEWIFVTFQIQYIFAATIGLVAGTARELGYWGVEHTHGRSKTLVGVPKRHVLVDTRPS